MALEKKHRRVEGGVRQADDRRYDEIGAELPGAKLEGQGDASLMRARRPYADLRHLA